ncbi:MAG: tryptophan--tRNA ligase, partial [Candidatus Omnitrophota bacterium]
CEGAAIGCTECKKRLAGIMTDYLAPIRERRNKITNSDIEDILRQGAKRAREAALETMAEVKKILDLVECHTK